MHRSTRSREGRGRRPAAPRSARVVAWTAIAVAIVAGATSEGRAVVERPGRGGDGASHEVESNDVELYFELKLLLRDRVGLRRVAVDQWVGGRLWMRTRAGNDGSRTFSLVRPLADPWVFRWYPTRNEVKLGAAVSVPSPAGDPYEALEPDLGALARQRYREWWSDDRVEPTATRRPSWQERANRFWAERHAAEETEKDPLHPFPVYPFHVLGDPRDRFAFTVLADGSVDAGSVSNRMSEPWLPRGWSEWLAGRPREGYGYWDSERPSWEPRTYEALVDALGLLAWSPFPPAGPAREGAGPEYSLAVDEIGERLAAVVRRLNPKFSGRMRWRGGAGLRFVERRNRDGAVTVTGDSDDRPLESHPAVAVRIWRHTLAAPAPAAPTDDEFQAFATDGEGETMKLWLKIGYRPFDPRLPAR